jgi:hypothetical protein
MRRRGAWWTALVLILPVSSPAGAEVVQVTNEIPAKFPEASKLTRIVVRPFSGDGGTQLSSAIAAELATTDLDGHPHFIVSSDVGGGRTAALGMMTGSVSFDTQQSNFTRQDSRCVEGAGLFKCKRSVLVNVYCVQRTALITVSIQLARSSDRKVVYTLSEPFRDARSWCEGQQAPTIAEDYAAFVPQLARRVAQEIAPHTETYQLKLLESTDGLDKPSGKTFKAAVKIAPRDLVDACKQWQQLTDSGQKSAALLFNDGICAEQQRDLVKASALYDQALALSPGDKRIAEGATRARNLVAAKAAAAQQVTERANAEAAAVAAERREQQQQAKAAAAAAAAARRQAAQAVAAENAAKSKRHAEVAAQYGAGAADSIIARKVTIGMTAAQARAAVGSGCAIERFGQGEELWSCNGKKIGFAKGRVTYVR